MIYSEFTRSFKRLTDIWPQSYKSEQVKMIWEIVEQMDDSWLERQINNFIINRKSAPLVADFQEAAKIEKRKTIPTYHQGDYRSIFSLEERLEMLSFIKDLASGKRSKQDAKTFSEAIQNALNSANKINNFGPCKICRGIGSTMISINGFKYGRACRCYLGEQFISLPKITDQEIENESRN